MGDNEVQATASIRTVLNGFSSVLAPFEDYDHMRIQHAYIHTYRYVCMFVVQLFLLFMLSYVREL